MLACFGRSGEAFLSLNREKTKVWDKERYAAFTAGKDAYASRDIFS